MITANDFGTILIEYVLPTCKTILLNCIGIHEYEVDLDWIKNRQNGNKKQRVTRLHESDLLSLLINSLVDILQSRFESLLCFSDFGLIWSQVWFDEHLLIFVDY